MRFYHMLSAVLVAMLWGGNFVASKFGVSYFPPFFYTALRFFLVALILVWFVPRPTWKQLKQITLIAFVLDILHVSFIVVALSVGLDVASSAIVTQLGVPFSCILGAVFLGDKLGFWRITGLIISFAGLFIVTGTPNIGEHPLGFFIALTAAFCWAISNMQVKLLHDISPAQLVAWLGITSIPQLLILSLIFENPDWSLLLHVPLPIMLTLCYTVVGSAIIAYIIWAGLLKRYDMAQVAPFSLLTPVFGIAFGQMFFSETLTWQVIVGGVVTLIGVGIIVIRRPKIMEIGEQL